MKSSREISTTPSSPAGAWLHHARFDFLLRRFLFAIFLCLLPLPPLDAAVDFPVTDAQGKPITATHWGEVTYWINRANANPAGNKISLKVLNARAVVEVAGKGMLVERDTVRFEAEITPIDGWTIVSVKFIAFNEEGTIQADKKKATFTMNFRKEPQPSTLLIGAKFRKNTDDPGDNNHKEEYIAAHVSVADLDTDSDNKTSSNRTHAEDLAENPAVGGTDLGKAVFYTPNADVDMDAVPDFADFNGIQPTGGSSAPWFPGMSLFLDGMPSGSKVRFVYSASDPAAVQQTTTNNVTTYEAAPGHLRVWTKNAHEIRNKEDILASGHYITPNTVYTLGQLNQHARNGRASPGLNHFTFFIEAIRPSTQTADQTVEVQLQFPGATDWVSLDKVSITLLPACLLVDMDRNGLLETTDLNLNRPQKPYRFWSNDDDDRSDKDHIESSRKDCADSEINSIRDLEDFARLNIFIGGLQDGVLNGSLKIGLKWKSIQTGAPSVKVWRNMSPNGGREYLFDETVANQHLTLGAPGHVQGTTTYFIPLVFWQQSGFSATQPNGYLIFEGCTVGKGQLVMTINKSDGTEIGEGPVVWLDIKNIKSMYERAVATTGGPRSENGVDYTIPLPYSHVGPDPSNIAQPSMGWEPNPQGYPYQSDPAETKTYLIYVHGWRWSPSKASNRTETVFKRLWHLGYKGRLSALRWPTFYGGPDDGDDWMAGLSTYNDSEYRAWKSGESLKQYVNQLPSDYTRSVIAHSMGNIVTGSALRKGMATVNYVLLNAAVPAMCYDESASLHQWNYVTPNDDPDVGTKDMAYVGKLKTLTPNVVNFFLTRDSATTFAWEANNYQFKPQSQIITSCVRGYTYARSNPVGIKLYVDFCVSPLRYLIDEDEAMAFACQSLTKTIGAEGRASGSIDSTVDMDAYSFGDEHGAEWDRNIMQTKAFYIQLMRSLQIPVQP